MSKTAALAPVVESSKNEATPTCVTPAELQAAALIFARALREHLADGLARGQLETVLSGARCLEHFAGLAGSAVAAQAFKAACAENTT